MPQPPQQEQRTRCQRWQDFLMKNVLPIGFFVVLVWALLWPLPGKRASKPEVEGFRVVSTINILVIFIISGLTLKTDDIANSSAWLGYTYGVFAILVLTPCVGFAAAELPFEDHEFSYGLAVFCVVPTTLTSGVTLVMQVRYLSLATRYSSHDDPKWSDQIGASPLGAWSRELDIVVLLYPFPCSGVILQVLQVSRDLRFEVFRLV